MTDNKDGFTDGQWKMVNQLLSQNRMNDEQFGIFVDMLDTSTQKLYSCMQVEEQEKHLLHVKSLKSWPGKMKFVVASVQPGWVLCTYHKVKLSIVFSRHGHHLSAGTAIDEIFKSLGGNQLKMAVVDEVSMLSTQFLVLLDTRL